MARMRETTMDLQASRPAIPEPCGVSQPLLTFSALPLQGRPRRPLPSFTSPHPEGHNLGFFLGRGRCTATAQADGGLRDSPAAYWDRGVNPRPSKPGSHALCQPHQALRGGLHAPCNGFAFGGSVLSRLYGQWPSACFGAWNQVLINCCRAFASCWESVLVHVLSACLTAL